MPCTYHFKKKPDLLIKVFWGNVTLCEVLSMYDRLLIDPKLPTARFEYCDLSGIEETNLDARSMKKLFDILSGQYLRRLDTFERGATIADSGPSQFIAHRYRMSLPEDVAAKVKIVASHEEALDWLGLGSTQIANVVAR